MTKYKLRAFSSALILIFTAYAFVMMLVSKPDPDALLKVSGLENLKFFTLDSNILMAVVALIDFIFVIGVLRGRSEKIPGFVEVLYYTGTAAVTLTFLTVMLFLGPLYGYGKMLERSNLYFHLLTPLLSVISFIFLHRGRYIKMREVFISMLPMVIYGIYYTALVLLNGIDYPNTDWYNFASGGMKTVPFVIVVMLTSAFAISFILKLACGKKSKEK